MRRATFAPPALAAGFALSPCRRSCRRRRRRRRCCSPPKRRWRSPSPAAPIERQTVYLTAAEVAAARELAGTALASAVVHPYRARRGGERQRERKAGGQCGTAYFDTHRVRTLAETVMVAIDPAGRRRAGRGALLRRAARLPAAGRVVRAVRRPQARARNRARPRHPAGDRRDAHRAGRRPTPPAARWRCTRCSRRAARQRLRRPRRNRSR